MSYNDWRTEYTNRELGSADQAQLWNIENEKRIDQELDEFKIFLGEQFAICCTMTENRQQAAVAAFDKATSKLKEKGNPWLGRKKATIARQEIRAPRFTHFPVDSLSYFGPVDNLSSTAYAQPRISYPVDIKKSKRFFWITFPNENGHMISETDPTAVVRELGLAHYPPDSTVYRFILGIDETDDLYIPTALDAAFYHAWSPPSDSNSPWGLTRDIVDGTLRWPELLCETIDQPDDLSGELVSPSNTTERIASLMTNPNWMAGRA